MRSFRSAAEKPCGGDLPVEAVGRLRSSPNTAKITILPPKRPESVTEWIVISISYRTNSLLSGSVENQWNFFADQRIKNGLSTE
jgi:hypothetical protein